MALVFTTKTVYRILAADDKPASLQMQEDIHNLLQPFVDAGKNDGTQEIIEEPGVYREFVRLWVDQQSAQDWMTAFTEQIVPVYDLKGSYLITSI